jgi:hypothetical protein
MVTKTPEELAAMSPEEIKEHQRDEEMTVFGRTRLNEPDFKKVKGQPVEMGVGSPGRENGNHFAAILKYQGVEAHQEALRDIWKRDPERAKKLSLPKPKETKAA